MISILKVRNNVNIGHWLIRHESLSLESFRKHDILPAINSYVWLFREVANVSFLLDDVYSIHNNKVTLTRNPIGKWSPTSGLDIDDTNPIQERRRDLMGISFKATVIHARHSKLEKCLIPIVIFIYLHSGSSLGVS